MTPLAQDVSDVVDCIRNPGTLFLLSHRNLRTKIGRELRDVCRAQEVQREEAEMREEAMRLRLEHEDQRALIEQLTNEIEAMRSER